MEFSSTPSSATHCSNNTKRLAFHTKKKNKKKLIQSFLLEEDH